MEIEDLAIYINRAKAVTERISRLKTMSERLFRRKNVLRLVKIWGESYICRPLTGNSSLAQLVRAHDC